MMSKNIYPLAFLSKIFYSKGGLKKQSLDYSPPSDSPQEKCGICGVYGKNFEAARLVYFGLWALQHRGQESSGISSTDGKTIRTHKDEGLVAHVYNEESLAKLKGYAAIGHNRYGTSGGSDPCHAQPVTTKKGLVTLAHNGNLPSVEKLKKFLEKKDITTIGFNDSELMQKAIEYYLLQGKSIEYAVKKCFLLFTGAFTLLLLTKDTIVAVRDSKGIRPLSLGRLDDGYVVASETCALDTMGATFTREVKPGEMIVINENGCKSYQLEKGEQKLDIFELIYFARPDSQILGKSVNGVRKRLGVELAKEYIVSADMVIPVPDSAIPAAVGYSQTTGIPLNLALIKNRYIHRTFIRPDQKLRERDVMIKLNPLASEIEGKEVALVDDSIVRGTTSKKIVSLLKKAGATKVHLLVTSPPIRYPDFYGIDTPSQKELIAAHKTVEEIQEFIGADTLYYLSYNGMITATGLPEKVFATYQFTGKYPIPLQEVEKTVDFSLIPAKEKKHPQYAPSVIGIGALNMDFFYHNYSPLQYETKISETLKQAGGAAANTLCALSSLEVTTSAIGKIGEDPEGMALLKSLRKFYVDETYVASSTIPSGKSFVFVDKASGKRAIRTESGANSALDVNDISMDYVKSAPVLLLSTFLDDKQVSLQEKILHEVRGDVRPFLWFDHHVVSYGENRVKKLLKYADTVFIKESVLPRLTGFEGKEGAQYLLSLGGKTIVSMKSVYESEIYSEGQVLTIRVKPTLLQDETGSSCAYAAGYIFGQLHGYTLKQSGFLGNVMASTASQAVGCRTALPNLSELLQRRSLLQEEKNVLVVGSGGREHAIAWKLHQSDRVKRLYVAPGNPGMVDVAHPVNIPVDDIDALKKFVKDKQIDLTIIGPEGPLGKGIVDEFEKEGLLVFGPSQKAAELETSKSFTKDFMKKFHIPTAKYEIFTDFEKAKRYIEKTRCPIVIKADGLAAGKGVLVAQNKEEALAFLEDVMQKKKFGDAGSKVVIEEYLEGEEASVLAFTDGVHVIPLLPAQDHKRIFDGDRGLNTGGMGAYAPAPIVTPKILEEVVTTILEPTIKGMKKIGRPYKGILYAGIMVTKKGPKVVEFNCRFGDPEAQAILPLLQTDLLGVIEGVLQKSLDKVALSWKKGSGVCIILAAPGYPEKAEVGKEVMDLSQVNHGAYVFHSGTKAKLLTAGGRVLGIFGTGSTLQEAINTSYKTIDELRVEGMQYRHDIGKKGLKHS